MRVLRATDGSKPAGEPAEWLARLPSALVHHAPCPVLVVRDRTRALGGYGSPCKSDVQHSGSSWKRVGENVGLRGRKPALGAPGGVLEEVQKSGKVRAHADLATTGPALGWDASLSPAPNSMSSWRSMTQSGRKRVTCHAH